MYKIVLHYNSESKYWGLNIKNTLAAIFNLFIPFEINYSLNQSVHKQMGQIATFSLYDYKHFKQQCNCYILIVNGVFLCSRTCILYSYFSNKFGTRKSISLHVTDEVKLSITLQEKVGCKSPVEALREIRQRKDNWKG